MNKKHNHPKPKEKKLIAETGSSYSPNSIGGRINLVELMEKLSFNATNQITNDNFSKDSKKGL
jgi:hypothetical protein